MTKTDKKRIIYGVTAAAALISCCIEFQLIVLWNLGFALFIMGGLIARMTRELRSFSFRAFLIIILALGSAPFVALMCLPSMFLCRVYSIKNPECGVDLPSFKARGLELRNASYYKNCNTFLFEGDVDEGILKKAAVRQNWEFKEITAPLILTETAKSAVNAHKGIHAPVKVEVEEGFVFSSYKDFSDCGEKLVFDRKNKRLYFSASLR
ncbi:MAG: hypothetical protein J6S54_07150 [Lentisphaeria bacterium]|nr:hypothetical protein [Lentisphaeria bacterium]